MNHELERIKEGVPILDLAKSYGYQLKRAGADCYKALCRWHPDKNPSLTFWPSSNTFHCFGCGKGKTVIDFVIYQENVDSGNAIKTLKARYKHMLNLNDPLPDKEKGSSAQKPPSNEAELLHPNTQKLLNRVVEYYHNSLKNSSRPIEYLIKRKIRQGELVDQFKVGYSDGTLLDKLTDQDRASLREAGIINEHGYERFKDCIVFPVINEAGQITEIYGRCLDKERGRHFYLPGPHKGIFNPKALNHKEIFLCESIIDCLSIMSLGYVNVTTSFGINGFTDEMLEIVKKKSIEKVYICYDSDKQAEKAISFSPPARSGRGVFQLQQKLKSSLSEKLKEINIEVYRVLFPCKDANEFICKTEEPAKEFEHLVSEATVLYQKETKADELQESWEYRDHEHHFSFGNRLYTARGLEKNKTNTSLKLFLKLVIEDKFHIDNSLDLFNSKLCLVFCKTAGLSLDIDSKVIKADLDRIIQILDHELEKQLANLQDKKQDQKKKFQKDIAISLKAVEFLKDPLMIVRFVKDVVKCGIVGESLNVFYCFLATLSRFLPEKIHVIIQSESSSGKSTILNLIRSFVPEDQVHYFTQVSPNSFYYQEDDAFIRSCIFIAESEGMEQAAYAVKQMMSEDELSKSSTVTDPQTGEFRSVLRNKKTSSVFMLTIPKTGFDEEVENRSVVLTTDESLAQTIRVQEQQRKKRSPEGIRALEVKKECQKFYQHVQMEFQPYHGTQNRYIDHLSFNTENQRTRRDNEKYLATIDCITLLFFKHRETFTDTHGHHYLRTHLIDIVLAHFIVRRLFTTTVEDLPPQAKNFYSKICRHLQEESVSKDTDILSLWLNRKQMREITRLSNTRVSVYSKLLEDYGYFASKRFADGIYYRLCFEPDLEGNISSKLNLKNLDFLKKKATRHEREEYEAFIPYLKEIFKALDPTYQDGEY